MGTLNVITYVGHGFVKSTNASDWALGVSTFVGHGLFDVAPWAIWGNDLNSQFLYSGAFDYDRKYRF